MQVRHEVYVLRGPEASTKGGIGSLVSASASKLEVAAVVVASHSRGGLEEALLGSVANWLSHNCDK